MNDEEVINKYTNVESMISIPEYDSFRIKITILGNSGVGKSSLCLRFAKTDFVDYYEPTIEEE
jgi:GTPase SAR1 family protein